MIKIECSICCELLMGSATEDVRATFCGHLFHNGCLKDWLSRSETCPVCRTALRQDNCIRLFMADNPQIAKTAAIKPPLSPDEKLRSTQLKSTISATIIIMQKLLTKIDSISLAKIEAEEDSKSCANIRKKLLRDCGGSDANNSFQVNLKNTEKKISDALGHIKIFEEKMHVMHRSIIDMVDGLKISDSGDQNRNSSAPLKNYLNTGCAKKNLY